MGMFGLFAKAPPQLLILATQPGDGAALMALHAEGFERPWNAAEFDQLLTDRAVIGHRLRHGGRPQSSGFVLSRMAADEAEILSIVVARIERGKGLSRALMAHHLSALTQQRIRSLFLEVDSTNMPAIRLYRHFGFEEIGKRRSYYSKSDGTSADALVMRRAL
jgi:[ribosomal protein S18]-alanine N-acetyltransferase